MAVGVRFDPFDRAPPTLASAAWRTLLAVSPVSGVSSLRWPPHGCWGLGAERAAALFELELEPEPDPLAAFAMP
jgi:hypothetical protein